MHFNTYVFVYPGLTVKLHDGEASTEPIVTVTGNTHLQMSIRLKLTILEERVNEAGWLPVHSLEKSFNLGKRGGGRRRKDGGEGNFEVVFTNWNRVASLNDASPVKILCVVFARPCTSAPSSLSG